MTTTMMMYKNNNEQQDQRYRQRILEKSRTDDDDTDIVKQTLDWLQYVVIGLNLCPFAIQSFLKDQITIKVVRGGNPTDILAETLDECWKLSKIPSKSDDANKGGGGGTTLMVCPDLHPNDFMEFLSIYNVLQDGILEDQNLSPHIQIAPFHPQFVFASHGVEEEDIGDDDDDDDDDDDMTSDTRDSDIITTDNGKDDDEEDDNWLSRLASDDDIASIDNYTNRSPYPIFHILREEEVSKAVETLHGDASIVWKRNVDLLNTLETTFTTGDDDCQEEEEEEDGTNLLRDKILKGKIEVIMRHKRQIRDALQSTKKKEPRS
jgi:hypothetical protein